MDDSVVGLFACARNHGVIIVDTLCFKQLSLNSASAAAVHIGSLSKIQDRISRYLLLVAYVFLWFLVL